MTRQVARLVRKRHRGGLAVHAGVREDNEVNGGGPGWSAVRRRCRAYGGLVLFAEEIDKGSVQGVSHSRSTRKPRFRPGTER